MFFLLFLNFFELCRILWALSSAPFTLTRADRKKETLQFPKFCGEPRILNNLTTSLSIFGNFQHLKSNSIKLLMLEVEEVKHRIKY